MTVATAQRPAILAVRSRLPPHLVDSFAIACGVAAVILAVAVSHSASTLAKQSTGGLGRDVVVVASTAVSASGVQTGLPTSSLTPNDVLVLGNPAFVPAAEAVAPTTGLSANVQALSRTFRTDVIGSTDAFARVLGYQLSQGRFLTPADVQLGTPDIVLGQAVVNALFAGSDPIGQDVTISDQTFVVVGTLAARGYSGSYNQDNLVVVPITAAWSTLLPHLNSPIDQVLIRAASPTAAAAAAREATTTLLSQNGVIDPSEADFTVLQQSQLVAGNVQTALALRRLLELAGAALLLAGAIQLAISPRRVRSVVRESSGAISALSAVLVIGLIGAVAGLILALILAPNLHDLARIDLPAVNVTIYGALAGAASGIVAALVSLLPAAVQTPSRPASGPSEAHYDQTVMRTPEFEQTNDSGG
jgi:putative ABC transport system permease protein